MGDETETFMYVLYCLIIIFLASCKFWICFRILAVFFGQELKVS